MLRTEGDGVEWAEGEFLFSKMFGKRWDEKLTGTD